MSHTGTRYIYIYTYKMHVCVAFSLAAPGIRKPYSGPVGVRVFSIT